MPQFSSGTATKIYANGTDVSAYFNQASSSGQADVAETTGFGKQAKTYIPGQLDATFTASGMYDSTTGAIADVATTALAAADTELLYWPYGDTLGSYGYGIQATETNFTVTSPVDGVNAVSLEAQSNVAAERVVSLRALAAGTAAGTATSVDETAASTAGYVGYLNVSQIAGGTLTVTLEDSANNSAFASVASFTAVSGTVASSERIAAAGTVRRYVRTTWTLNGGTATFNVGIGRRPSNI